jgi:hypothetical protein
MNMERAQQIITELRLHIPRHVTPLVYDMDNWNDHTEPDPECRPGVSEADANHMFDAQSALQSSLLTERLARARWHLSQVSPDTAPDLRAAVDELLVRVDEGLLALDLTPDDPLVKAAAETPED